MNLVTEREAPPNRIGKQAGPLERHLTEAAVMLAMAEWFFGQGAKEVFIHPDGLHMAGFDILGWLTSRGFTRIATTGRTQTSGRFQRNDQTIIVHSRPGLGDIVTQLNGVRVEVEAKGGCLNTRHAGQLSRLRKGLHEAVGQLLGSPYAEARLIAAVPRHVETARVAERLLPRCRHIGIEIALVDADGSVFFAAGLTMAQEEYRPFELALIRIVSVIWTALMFCR